MRYDAAIIGAGAEGLAAAILLGRAGLRVLVIERGSHAGGRLVTREFHPGFRASPFVDDIAEIPPRLFWSLDLARHGAIVAPPRVSRAVWQDRRHEIKFGENAEAAALLAVSARRRAEIAARVDSAAKTAPSRPLFLRRDPERWPAEDWATATLDGVLASAPLAPDAAAHLAALALSQSIADPFLEGSALHLLAAGASGHRLAGGPARLGEALLLAAQSAGAEFSFGLEASDIHRRNGRITGVGLADGSEIAAQTVISTLDLKRTFLTFFAWNALPPPLVRGVNAFRMAGSTARVLFAVARRLAEDGPIHVAPSLSRLSEAFQAWRAGVAAAHLPVTLNVVSARDPRLAPPSFSVVTATMGAIPFRLFDGAWTHEKREQLRHRATEALEFVWPGAGGSVVASDVVAPPDIEEAFAATDGDLLGGEIAGDQMLGAGPWSELGPDRVLPRTPVAGLYLAGSHLAAGAFATCAAGAAAAHALLADRARGWLR
ncbi:MAG TPA: FAD-dependent oxidoreductase [Rhizomicrobium sp.]|nr:FAD-dependent oxidoreductase [Rhizomicrobium sp.]